MYTKNHQTLHMPQMKHYFQILPRLTTLFVGLIILLIPSTEAFGQQCTVGPAIDSVTVTASSYSIQSGGRVTIDAKALISYCTSQPPATVTTIYEGVSGDTSKPVLSNSHDATAFAIYDTPPLTQNTSYWARVTATAGTYPTSVKDSNTVTIAVAQAATNPIDDARFFVRQQYLDFLNREPDQGGFDFWTGLITACKDDAQCVNSKRVTVSAAFFIEQEFQLTGNYIYRMYKAAYGQGHSPSYAQFTPDRARINPDANQIEASKQAFADLFVQRPEFLAMYPTTMAPDVFVGKLIDVVRAETNGAVDLSSKRGDILNTLQTSGRGSAVRKVAEDASFQSAEYNKAFVTMQYYGYLRRDYDDAGYGFWLDVLNNRVKNNYRGMVCAFITSAEYQYRFSSVLTRNDSICGQIGQ